MTTLSIGDVPYLRSRGAYVIDYLEFTLKGASLGQFERAERFLWVATSRLALCAHMLNQSYGADLRVPEEWGAGR